MGKLEKKKIRKQLETIRKNQKKKENQNNLEKHQKIRKKIGKLD